MKKIISPFIYIASAIFVIPVVVFFIDLLEKTIGLHAISRTGDIDSVLIILVSGAVIFGLVTKFIVKFENNKKSSISDHFRYSGILYLILLFSLTYLALNPGAGLGNALVALMSGVMFMGIITNAVVLATISKIKNG